MHRSVDDFHLSVIQSTTQDLASRMFVFFPLRGEQTKKSSCRTTARLRLLPSLSSFGRLEHPAEPSRSSRSRRSLCSASGLTATRDSRCQKGSKRARPGAAGVRTDVMIVFCLASPIFTTINVGTRAVTRAYSNYVQLFVQAVGGYMYIQLHIYIYIEIYLVIYLFI